MSHIPFCSEDFSSTEVRSRMAKVMNLMDQEEALAASIDAEQTRNIGS